eukprot:CAMPEP_0196765262 /NCGR_PEP_ID=MMETSP1095-20130614/7906_1 /TAXON_ID=96789 ORGANISM="Chromulina nebulosa, Strain UTEXLB2642" /NCGR_SAMPLE_ID=MMETSP1095 /ASSEMBLY_ACC=CAM_ASM_000446 /LENGTH=899 /DNA_ID=CAMNT_0042123011 /DNA_START=298 /DNA_END=2997 /DNA_ORIENTATION=+
MQGIIENEELRGVTPNAFSHIFEYIKATKHVKFLIRCSYLEIYNEEILDLLSPATKNSPKCEIGDDPVKGIYVKNLTHVVVDNEEQLEAQLEKGIKQRTVASTQMNSESSRSHSIFSVVIEMSTTDESGSEHVRAGKLNLVDLAGSERQKKTGATGQILKEGAGINLSLLTLGNVISALAEGKAKHIKYRDSKLTRLLQDSLGGNTKTCMIATISPADYNYEETYSTLRYANRAKNIRNKPRINEDPKETMIREFKEEIERLKKLLAQQSISTTTIPINTTNNLIDNSSKENFSIRVIAESKNNNLSDDKIVINEKKLHKSNQEKSNEINKSDPNLTLDQYFTVAESRENIIDSDNKENIESADKAIDETNKEDNYQDDFSSNDVNIDQEKQLRDEINLRLQDLQSKLVGNDNITIDPKQEAERLEAEQIHNERILQAKLKKQQQDAIDLEQVLEEKRAIEDELEDLRQALAASQTNSHNNNTSSSNNEKDKEASIAINDNIDKRINKLKKKFEKKLLNSKQALEEAKEDFQYQREQLSDSLEDEEKQSQLYLTILKSLLTEKEIKKIVSKASYDEESRLWTLTHIKASPRPASSLKNSINNNNNESRGSSTDSTIDYKLHSTSFLPDISANNTTNSSNNYQPNNMNSGIAIMNNNNINNNNIPMIKLSYVSSSVDSLPPMNYNRPISRGKVLVDSTVNMPVLTNRVSTANRINTASKKSRQGNRIKSNKIEDEVDIKPNNNITNMIDSKVDNDNEIAKKKKVKKIKIDKEPVVQSNDPLPDEAGAGEYAGPLSEWGFAAVEDTTTTRSTVNPNNNNYVDNIVDKDYSDDDFEPDDQLVKPSKSSNGKKKKSKKIKSVDNNIDTVDNSILQPINTNRSSQSSQPSKLSQSSITTLPQLI